MCRVFPRNSKRAFRILGQYKCPNAEIRDLPPNTGVCISEHCISLVFINWDTGYGENLIIMTVHINIA